MTQKTDLSTPDKANARVPANKPKKRALRNVITRETSQKRVLASKPKNALCIIESTSKTDLNTPNEAMRAFLRMKQNNALHETKRHAKLDQRTRSTANTASVAESPV